VRAEKGIRSIEEMTPPAGKKEAFGEIGAGPARHSFALGQNRLVPDHNPKTAPVRMK
jgi:hypothetical protein